MWYYITATNDAISDGNITFEEYRHNLRSNIQNLEELLFRLEQQGLAVDHVYEDTAWVRTKTDRDYTVLTLMLMRYDAKISNQVKSKKELKGLYNV